MRKDAFQCSVHLQIFDRGQWCSDVCYYDINMDVNVQLRIRNKNNESKIYHKIGINVDTEVAQRSR